MRSPCITTREWTLLSTSRESLWSVQFSHFVVSDSCNPMDCSMTGFTVHHQLLKLIHTHVHLVGDAIQPSHPLVPFSSHLQSFTALGSFPINQFFSSVAKILEFQLQHQSFQWIFRTDFLYDWLVDLLAVQGTLKNLLQHHSSKASILQRSAFFTIQLSHPYMTTGKINHSFD